MIYIVVPEGMHFEKMMVGDHLKDCFVSEDRQKIINFQEIVNRMLQNWPRHCDSATRNRATLEGLTVYAKKPYMIEQTLLAYEPERNAARPTPIPPSLIEKGKASPASVDPAHQTSYGMLWRTYAVLSPERGEEERKKAQVRRSNLRKAGPSPASN